jgi:hypothetical protein
MGARLRHFAARMRSPRIRGTAQFLTPVSVERRLHAQALAVELE